MRIKGNGEIWISGEIKGPLRERRCSTTGGGRSSRVLIKNF
jgi:hypothetical protein